MPSGGYRPGGGRPKGSKDKKPRKKRTDFGKKKKPNKTPKPKTPIQTPETELNERIKKLLEAGTSAKAKAFRDLANRLATGQKLTAAEMKAMVMLERELTETVKVPPDIAADADAEDLDPLTYMLKVMNDQGADKDRRDRMAIASAPYLHKKADESKTKKQELEDRAKAVSGGRFAPSAPPLKRVK